MNLTWETNISKSVIKMTRLVLFVITICLVVSGVNCDGFQLTLGHLKPQTNESTQTKAVLDLIERLLPDRVSEFNVTIDQNCGPIGKDTFHVTKTENNIIHITGTSGVAAAWGFNHYLKYFCNSQVSWQTVQLNIPEKLPDVNISITSNDRFRYYQNVCTASYSFVWWHGNDWIQHIDWMAMNSINLALAFNGQEAIWKRVYQKFNLTEDEINEHFTGPAFNSWSRMGNIRGWGGPLPNLWLRISLFTQKLILKYMRNLGITPVLPAFAGHVPKAFKRIFPEANMTKLNTWNNFEDKYCCPYLLDPMDPLFNIIGKAFMEEQISEFGTDHIYNCDTFNEMVPPNKDLGFLSNISKSIYSAMTNVDPQAIWLLQGWMFYSEKEFWQNEQVNAFLNAVPTGKIIVLDLQSEQFPQYSRLDSYFGQPFIWCMLHNFGGTLGMFGSANKINTDVFEGRNYANSTMIGTGLTPEGINQNYVIYDLMLENAWRKKPSNLTKWFKHYVKRRYGQEDENASKAWEIFKDTVYSYDSIQKMRGKYVINRSPRLNIKPTFWYNTTEFMQGWDYLLSSADKLHKNKGYRHDLVDVTRQALQILGDLHYPLLIQAFKNKHIRKFQTLQTLYTEIFKDLDLILASNTAFLLGPWLVNAKSYAEDTQESRLLEYNARNQISLWGPKGEIKDYASKQWAGVVSHLFGPRWDFFLSAMNVSLVTKQPFDEKWVASRVFTEIEVPFTTDTNEFPLRATGDSIQIARGIHKRWRNKTNVARIKNRGRARVQRSSVEQEELPQVITI